MKQGFPVPSCRLLLSTLVVVGGVSLEASAATLGYWQFEDAPGFLEDSSAANNDLTPVSDPAQVTTPFTGLGGAEAADLDGNDYFTSTASVSGASAFTFEALIRPRDNDRYIVGQWGSNNNRAFVIELDSGNSNQLRLVLESPTDDSNTLSYLDGSAIDPIVLNDNYYIAVAYDGPNTEATFYAKNLTTNGPLQSSVVQINEAYTSLETTTGAFELGEVSTVSGDVAFDGIIDEVRLSDSVLSGSELLVPEPTSTLLVAGGGLLALARRRRA